MADWNKLGSRGTVEDRRGLGPMAGGLGIGGVILYLAFSFLTGGSISPDTLNTLLQESQVQRQNIDTSQFAGADSYEVFVATVLGSTNDMWSQVFAQNNMTYEPPKLVLFRGATQSSCGGASSAVGPHYCPTDATIYLDETFFEELTSRFGAQGGDVAEAYVIAHEVGHHAQNMLGLIDQANSIHTELQADCFAGLWAYSVRDKGVFEPGEIQEALDAAAAVGDDRIQKMQTGHVSPETWTHGSSADRAAWFTKGYESGDLNQCEVSAE